MSPSLGETFRLRLDALDARSPDHVVAIVDLALSEARRAGASDIHLTPTAAGLEMRWRIDGVLQEIATMPVAIAPNVASRLKVMSNLLTYRTDVPQEGRIRGTPGDVEMRVSTFPTLHGEKTVVRLFAESGRFRRLADLGLPEEVRGSLERSLGETAGAILLAGPAGAGKTTTLYACLRELVAATEGRRSLATLEDPIESSVPGVAQSQVNPNAGFDLATGLRSLMRQDPEVIAVGEIRDRATAEGAFGASLTGHLVLSTFHGLGQRDPVLDQQGQPAGEVRRPPVRQDRPHPGDPAQASPHPQGTRLTRPCPPPEDHQSQGRHDRPPIHDRTAQRLHLTRPDRDRDPERLERAD